MLIIIFILLFALGLSGYIYSWAKEQENISDPYNQLPSRPL